MDRMESSRKTDSDMDVIAPFAGRVTSRNAAVGMLVQPGMSPAPLVISDISTMWLIAAVPEQDLPALHLGQKVSVSVDAYPTRQFEAKISNIGETVDPTTRRILVRSEVRDPKHELRPQMFATFVIQTGNPVTDVGVPVGGVVREGDGTMLVWVTKDRTEFFPRPVKTGIVQDGYEQILSGVSAGEQVATEGALFLSNALATSSK
jgi:cobalt-zinc-cadmium efflux system membrane fusion protein